MIVVGVAEVELAVVLSPLIEDALGGTETERSMGTERVSGEGAETTQNRYKCGEAWQLLDKEGRDNTHVNSAPNTKPHSIPIP